MPRKIYTMTVVGCALAWLLVGTHLPLMLHELFDAPAPRAWMIGLGVLLVVGAVWETRILLRAPLPWIVPDGRGTPGR